MPCPPARKGRLEMMVPKVRQAIQAAPKVRKESQAMKDRSARKECRAFKVRLVMMEPSVRKESKAFKAKPGCKESLEILAVQSVLKAQQVPTAQMEPKAPPVK